MSKTNADQLLEAAIRRAGEVPAVPVDRDRPGSFDYLAQYKRVYTVVGQAIDLAWGTMVYACDGCDFEHRVWLGVGVEGPPALREHEATIPCPMVAGRCPKCDGRLSHVRWSEDEQWPTPKLFEDGVARFVVPDGEQAEELASSDYGGAAYRNAPERQPQPDDDQPYLRCTLCARELTKGEAATVRGRCPRCGTKSLPMRIADDVEVKVNWHELRILGMWAEQWASAHKDKDPGMQRAVNVICGRLQAQHTDKPGLTMSAELADVRDAGFDIEAVEGFSEDEEAKGPE